ncbi:MAG TPA: hypothetical protein VFD33_06270 [Bacillota bacterium]|nr:hypothetical protein [Bacillota bacterium]
MKRENKMRLELRIGFLMLAISNAIAHIELHAKGGCTEHAPLFSFFLGFTYTLSLVLIIVGVISQSAYNKLKGLRGKRFSIKMR